MPEIRENVVELLDEDGDGHGDGDDALKNPATGRTEAAARAGTEIETEAEDTIGKAEPGSETGSGPESGTEPEPEPEPVPWRPIVARRLVPILVATLLLEAGILLRLGPHLSTLPLMAFAAPAVALAVVDFAILRLPNALTEPMLLAVVALLVLEALADHHPHRLVTELEGGLVIALFYLVLYAVTRGGMGLGDVKLGATAGMVMAAKDWTQVYDGTLLSYFTLLVITVVMLTRGRKRFPYGPGLLIGTIAVMLIAP
ncbi:hypothetical protein GCM10009839_14970 [Catenulispora yoronensis]|uniref:Prepilin type IV endopeptidase peptidase domain-containing protein n=1 Tax=Catenulispora yoronensis TaxID=450799 RepID=A0ABP5F7C8_9ACTN